MSKQPYVTAMVDGDGFAKAAFSTNPAQTEHRFLSRIFALNRENPGAKIGVAWDRPDSSDGRIEVFPAYKAARREGLERDRLAADDPSLGRRGERFGDDYRAAVERIRDVLEALGVASIEAPGWEADDVIATVVRRSRGGRRLVLTRDRDLLQLVSRDVDVLLRVGSDDRLMNLVEVNAFLPVPVGLYRDFKALAGDPGDGVPGVPGVGEKKAVELLKWNPSVVPETSALGRPQGVPPKGLEGAVGKLVEAGREYVRAMRFAVSLHDVELEVRRGRFDRGRAAGLLESMRLRRLGERLGEWRATPGKRVRRIRRRALDLVDLVAVDLGVELTRVESSNLWAVGERGEDLLVLFRKRRLYAYPGAARLLRPLLGADSKGSFFATEVAGLVYAEVDVSHLLTSG